MFGENMHFWTIGTPLELFKIPIIHFINSKWAPERTFFHIKLVELM